LELLEIFGMFIMAGAFMFLLMIFLDWISRL